MTPLQTRIVKNVWRFDPISLLQLLAHLGYSMDEILFCSHFSACSQSRLVESIVFHNAPRQAVITLNLGLLGGQSVLPNYLFKLVHNDTIDTRQFAGFFGYFDDRLLRRFLLAIYPEFNEAVFQSWETRKKAALHTLKLDSIITLHWLTQLVFPELQVRVEKATLKRNIELGAFILGKSSLGYQNVFGKKKEFLVSGKRITLITDEESFTNGKPWPHEIDRRLQQLIFPILRSVGLDLEIWLVIRTESSWLKLKQNSYLGYENIVSDKVQFRRIRIFSGRLYDWH